MQKNHYYPFGMAFAEKYDVSGNQPFKYNGKELDSEMGLNTYDYSARTYEPAYGRFTSVDPLAENYYSWSPYCYTYNNPIRYIDPDGKGPGDVVEGFVDGFIAGVTNTVSAIITSPISAGQSVVDHVEQNSRLATVDPGVASNNARSTALGVAETLANSTKAVLFGAADAIDAAVGEIQSGGDGSKTATAVGEKLGGAAVGYGLMRAADGLAPATGTGTNAAKSLSNPYKNMNLNQVRKAMDKQVKSGKLDVKVIDSATGKNKTYQNTKSGYSYNLDKGTTPRRGGKSEKPHIDVNYPKPKPKNIPKKKLPVTE